MTGTDAPRLDPRGSAGAGSGPGEPVLIRSRLFAMYPRLVFGLSTRKGGVSPEPFGLNTSFKVGDDPSRVAANRERFLKKLRVPENRLAIPSQVHGSAVLLVSAPGRFEACDGLLTRTRELFLAVSVADCLPIFLFDPATESVGVVHAGWRGTNLGILANALERVAEGSSKPEHLIAFIGPGAGACCYEVGEEVARDFDPLYVDRPEGKRPHLDLKAANRAVLIGAGVPEQNIELSTYCTICNPDLLHSYRRDGKQSGRMMGVIGIM